MSWWMMIRRMIRRGLMRRGMIIRMLVVDWWTQVSLEGSSGLASTALEVESGLPPHPPHGQELRQAPVQEALAVIE
jgi:hypothetical protein